MNLREKEVSVGGLNKEFDKAELAILINYDRCTCEEMTKLRRELDKSGSKMRVVKNTLAKRALKGTDSEGVADFFKGQIAVIWSADDPVHPAKAVSDFVKSKENVQIKAGTFAGKVLSASEIIDLANMPSREQLLGKLLALINAPATRLLQTVNAPATQFVRLLGAWKSELEKKQPEKGKD